MWLWVILHSSCFCFMKRTYTSFTSKTSCFLLVVATFFKKRWRNVRCQMAVSLIAGDTQEGKRKEHLVNSPPDLRFPISQSGSHPLLGWSQGLIRGMSAAAMGACPEAGLGYLKAPSLVTGSSATENPCLQSVLVSLVSVSFRQEAVGRGTSWFPAAEPSLLEAPGMPGGGCVGWGGGCSEGKGKWGRLEPHHPPVFVDVAATVKGEDRHVGALPPVQGRREASQKGYRKRCFILSLLWASVSLVGKMRCPGTEGCWKD